jgi:hypothetical protein
MSMRPILLSLAAALLLSSRLYAQPATVPDDTLARVGASIITSSDFIERLELMPFPGKTQGADPGTIKMRALRALVAERLLAQDAALRGMGCDTASLRRRAGLERQMVRDELFKREVVARSTATDAEIAEGMRRYPYDLTLLFASAPSKERAAAMRDSIRGGDTVGVKFGSIDWALEDSAYALSAKRKTSHPVHSQYLGWGILRLIERKPNSEAASQSIPDRIARVRSIIQQRKIDQRAGEYQNAVLAPQRAVVDSAMFGRMARILYARLLADTSAHRGKDGFLVLLSDIDSVETAFTSQLDAEFVQISAGGMTVRDMLDAFRTRELTFPGTERRQFYSRLNASLKALVAAELLAREGYRQNLQQSDAVRHDMSTWETYWAASARLQVIRDSVTVNDDDVIDFLITQTPELGASYEVNVREVLSDSLSSALDVLQQAIHGKDLASLARTHSLRKAWQLHDGESGYFRVDSNPMLGFHALFQDSGAIAGPLHLKEGYSVFTTLGKRITGVEKVPPIDSLRYYGGLAARSHRQTRAVGAAVSSLAERAGVQLYPDRLSRVEFVPTNMVTLRFIGFGGSMLAMPAIMPLWNWKGEKQEGVVP